MIPLQQIHPMMVHFPIVFGLTLAAFDLLALFLGRSIGGRGAMANVSVSIATLAGLSAIVAAIFGDMALDIAIANNGPVAALEFHANLGIATATVLAIWAAIRLFIRWRTMALSRQRSIAIVAVEILFCALILTTAYYGGELVFAHGVAVATNG